jgi:hypothetical protein
MTEPGLALTRSASPEGKFVRDPARPGSKSNMALSNIFHDMRPVREKMELQSGPPDRNWLTNCPESLEDASSMTSMGFGTKRNFERPSNKGHEE